MKLSPFHVVGGILGILCYLYFTEATEVLTVNGFALDLMVAWFITEALFRINHLYGFNRPPGSFAHSYSHGLINREFGLSKLKTAGILVIQPSTYRRKMYGPFFHNPPVKLFAGMMEEQQSGTVVFHLFVAPPGPATIAFGEYLVNKGIDEKTIIHGNFDSHGCFIPMHKRTKTFSTPKGVVTIPL